MSKQNKTKICIVPNCQYSNGTRLAIRMFKIPQDQLIRTSWEKSFEAYGLHGGLPLKGMICVNHFCETDLHSATKSKPISLKDNAVPKIFNADISEDLGQTGTAGTTHDVNEVNAAERTERTDLTDPTDPNELCSNESCAYFRRKYKEVCKDKLNDDVKMQHLHKQIGDLKETIQAQSDQIKRLDMQLKRLNETKGKLKCALAELQKQSLLHKDEIAILEVRLKLSFM